jgi:hypothetical protein
MLRALRYRNLEASFGIDNSAKVDSTIVKVGLNKIATFPARGIMLAVFAKKPRGRI